MVAELAFPGAGLVLLTNAETLCKEQLLGVSEIVQRLRASQVMLYKTTACAIGGRYSRLSERATGQGGRLNVAPSFRLIAVPGSILRFLNASPYKKSSTCVAAHCPDSMAPSSRPHSLVDVSAPAQ